MDYRYDIHVHTQETSPCGHVPAADTVAAYHALGYAGLCITDHLHDGYLARLDCQDDWQACVTRYLAGYWAARRAGKALGMDILLGLELRFPENDSDYLIYGVDEAWLRANPYPCRMDHAAFFRRYGGSVLIIQAHPFRACDEVFTDSIHGLEVANCNPRHDSRNDLALALAAAHPSLYRLCGSDAHREGDEGRSAVVFEQRVRDSFALKAAIESRRYRLWCPAYQNIIEKSEAIGCGTTL